MKISENTVIYPQFWCIGLLVTVLWLGSCVSDQLPEPIVADCGVEEPTYTVDIKEIIDLSCAYSGCHLDSSPGRFDSYSGLLPYLQDNTFRQRVLIQRGDPTTGMPPNFAPNNRPINLTPEELIIIECWLNAGFPE